MYSDLQKERNGYLEKYKSVEVAYGLYDILVHWSMNNKETQQLRGKFQE